MPWGSPTWCTSGSAIWWSYRLRCKIWLILPLFLKGKVYASHALCIKGNFTPIMPLCIKGNFYAKAVVVCVTTGLYAIEFGVKSPWNHLSQCCLILLFMYPTQGESLPKQAPLARFNSQFHTLV